MSVAKHIRIIEPAPSDDFVSKREAAVKALRIRFLKIKTVDSLLLLGSTLALGCFGEAEISSETTSHISDALTKESPSFVADEKPLEIKLCGLLAILDAIEHGLNGERWSVADVLAVAVWSSLSFIPTQAEIKLEQLRADAIEKARKRVLKTAISYRQRTPVPEVGELVFDPAGTKLPEALGKAINALRNNAALDREEIDLLWWVLAEGSEVLNKPLSEVSSVVRAVVTGYEVGSMLRRLPSQAHNHLVLRNVAAVEPMSLLEMVDSLGQERVTIAAKFAKEPALAAAPHMFPALSAIRSGVAHGLSADMKRPLSEWAVRVLLESAVLRLQYSESSKL